MDKTFVFALTVNLLGGVCMGLCALFSNRNKSGYVNRGYVNREKAKVKTSGYQRTTIIYGCYFIRGSVVNNSHHATRYWQVQCHFYDKSGDEIDSATIWSTDMLLPGAEKRFEIIHPQIPEAIKLLVEVVEVTLIGLDSR